jgi:polysaccharide pyruvyl transferase WcaK-like protein
MSFFEDVKNLVVFEACSILSGRAASAGGVAVIPPAGVGNLGDAAMINVTARKLRERGSYPRLGMKAGWDALDAFDAYVDGNRYFYTGSRAAGLLLSEHLKRCEEVLLVGADIVDGVYNPPSVSRRLKVLRQVAERGARAAILGCSFSETPDASCLEVLRQLPASVRIKARDKVSRIRMEHAIGRPIEEVADLAFLLSPDHRSGAVEMNNEWVEARRRSGDRVVAVNANYIIDRKYEGFSVALTELMRLLLRRPVSLLLVPHDTRTERSDWVILSEAMAALSPSFGSRIRMMDPRSPEEVRAVLSNVDLVVTGRMHVAILAFSAGRPALGFGYQGKFEGLYDRMGLAEARLLRSPAALVEDPGAMAAEVWENLAVSEQLASRISVALPAVRRLALGNFA